MFGSLETGYSEKVCRFWRVYADVGLDGLSCRV